MDIPPFLAPTQYYDTELSIIPRADSRQFNAFSPLNGGTVADMMTYFTYPLEHYGQDYTRYSNARWVDPYPLVIGHLEGLIGFLDQAFMNIIAQAKVTNGPLMGAQIEPDDWIFPDINTTMRKVNG